MGFMCFYIQLGIISKENLIGKLLNSFIALNELVWLNKCSLTRILSFNLISNQIIFKLKRL